MSQKPRPTSISEYKQEEGLEDSFWQEYYPNLKRYCHFLTQNTWDGDDIAQETYLKALRYNCHKQKITSALLNKIAYHYWIDLIRKRKNETLKEDAHEGGQFFHQPNDKISNAVELLIERFTPKQAITLLLKEGFQYQLKEIAELLDTTEMAVKANLHRAKRRLEKETEDHFSVESFWHEEERERLEELFYKTLENQDPANLIEAIPTLTNVVDSPRLVPTQSQKLRYTPSSTLCMAA